MAIQVKLRGGTYNEHETFIGSPREVTVDTTSNTLRVHDGITLGGHPLTPASEFVSFKKQITKTIEGIEVNISQSHNHDDLYAKIVHDHNGVYAPATHGHSNYVEKVNGLSSVFSSVSEGHNGLVVGGTDSGWLRTTSNGIIPYRSGGYSSVGTSSWRFNEGWFNTINASTVIIPKNGVTSSIEFSSYGNDPGFIRHIESPTDISSMIFSVSDNSDDIDRFYFGGTPNGSFTAGAYITSDGQMNLNRGLVMGDRHMQVGGLYIFFDGAKPDYAPDGSISFG